jgi:hypothetical protein
MAFYDITVVKMAADKIRVDKMPADEMTVDEMLRCLKFEA